MISGVTKTTTVTARMTPELKSEAEEILEELGINSSIAINILYRQIVYCRGLPFPLTLPGSAEYDRSRMSQTQFESMMEKGYQEALDGKGTEADQVYDNVLNSLKGRAGV